MQGLGGCSSRPTLKNKNVAHLVCTLRSGKSTSGSGKGNLWNLPSLENEVAIFKEIGAVLQRADHGQYCRMACEMFGEKLASSENLHVSFEFSFSILDMLLALFIKEGRKQPINLEQNTLTGI